MTGKSGADVIGMLAASEPQRKGGEKGVMKQINILLYTQQKYCDIETLKQSRGVGRGIRLTKPLKKY